MKIIYSLGGLVLTAAMVGCAWNIPQGQVAWGVVAGCMLSFVVALGLAVTKQPFGILINERNLMSLSRFQTVLWTLIILSAYFVIAVKRAVHGVADPLAVVIDAQLWTLLGISVTSLVGTPLINSTKTQKEPDPVEAVKTARSMVSTNNVSNQAANASARAAAAPAVVADPAMKEAAQVAAVASTIEKNKQGTLYVNPHIQDASLVDMFEGEEVGNAAYLDLAKIQMFFFTVVIGFAYVVSLAKVMQAPETVGELPKLDPGLIALLGISNAAHLTSRGVDKTKLK